MRVAMAFLFAAFWLPAVSMIFDPSWQGVFWAKLVGIVTIPLTVFVAIPGFLLFRKRISFLLCVGGGLAVGLLGAGLFLLATNWLAFLNWSPVIVVIGLISGAGFWVIGFAGKPKPNNSLQADGP